MRRRMKLVISMLMTAVVSFTGCGGDNTSQSGQNTGSEQSSSVNAGTDLSYEIPDYNLAEHVSEGAILHCWNWSYNNITECLPQIAQAGFSAVQTSPVQQAKDYTYQGVVYDNVGTPNGTGANDGQWWKLYQPVTFSICDNGESFLGNKEEFRNMCEQAERYGVRVIVDVVANHMGNITGWKNSMSDITPQVGQYWSQEMMEDKTYWHINSIQCWMSDGRSDITQGTIGMPDLNTADKRVQNMVLDFLKECVDCGADGFRFDAAKHIETPDDNASIASDFWPTVIDGIREYSDHELFIYGEILNTPGDNFSITNYTKYMSVTDSATSDNRRNDVRYKNASSAANPSYSYDSKSCVVWNESHDTYVGAGSSYLATDTMIKQTWAIHAARASATPLFLARPYYSKDIVNDNGTPKSTAGLVQAKMGDVGTMTFADPSVAAINNFRNAFIGQSEYISSDKNTVYIERGTTGVAIINMDGAGEISLQMKQMVDGTYTDAVSGGQFVVSGGKLTGNITSEDGVAVVYNVLTVPYAEVSIPGGTLSQDSQTVTLTLKNATKGTYWVDDGPKMEFTDTATVEIGEGIDFGQHTTLHITADDGTKMYVYNHTYNKNRNENQSQTFDETSGKNHVYMKNSAGWEQVYCYMWTDDTHHNADWPGIQMTEKEDGLFLYATDTDYPNVIFNDGSGTQTADLEWGGNDSVFDNKSMSFSDGLKDMSVD